MTDQEKKAAFEGVLPLLVKDPAAREQLLNQYADAPKSSPIAAQMLEGASMASPFIAMRMGGTGAGLAATAANLAGMIAAAITKRRTAEEQGKADTGVLRNLAKLIPGVGAYDAMKRIGRRAQENVDRINERRAKRQAEKKADAHGMAKQAFSWADIKAKINDLAAGYSQLSQNKRMAINGAISALAGAGLGSMVAGEGNRGTGAILGALAGGAGGAAATKYIHAPKWFHKRVLAGIKARMSSDVKANDSMGRKYLQYIAENAKSDDEKSQLLANAASLGIPQNKRILGLGAALGEALGHPAKDSDYHTISVTPHFNPDSIVIR